MEDAATKQVPRAVTLLELIIGLVGAGVIQAFVGAQLIDYRMGQVEDLVKQGTLERKANASAIADLKLAVNTLQTLAAERNRLLEVQTQELKTLQGQILSLYRSPAGQDILKSK
jgi:hypothetical protein